MGLTQPYPTIYDQRIERIRAGLFGKRLTRTTGHPVAVTFDKSIESIDRVELSIDLHLLQPWDHKGILDGVVYNKWEIHFVVGKRFIPMSRNVHCQRLVLMITAIDNDPD